MSRSEDAEETRRKMQQRISELQEQFGQAQQRLITVEKSRNRVQAEVEDARVDADRNNQYAQSLQKKQENFDKIIEDWKRKCDDLHGEFEASQREARNLNGEVIFLIYFQNSLR